MAPRLVLLWIAALSAGCVAQATRADAPASRPAELACWHAGRIHVLDVDGAASRPIITKPEPERPMIWTPDGRSVIFGRDNTPDWSFFSVDADGTHEHPLGPQGEDSRSPAFSPDGSFIAYVSGRRGLCVMKADGTDARTLAPRAHRDAPPVWLAGGRHLEYVGVREKEPGRYTFHLDLRTVAVAGGDDRLIREDTENPSVSPDGRWVAAVTGGDITLRETGQKDAKPLAVTPDSESEPSWSPDGRQLACLATHGGHTDLCVFDVATGAHRVLAAANIYTCRPTWSPDGRWICFTAGEPVADVMVISPSGGEPRRITRGGGSWPVFRPPQR
jgi:TolB protein